MKILHFSTHYKISAGIENQISYEIKSASDLKISSWHNKIFSCIANKKDFITITNPTPFKLFNYLISRIYSFAWLRLNAKEYDIILLRHNLGDPFEFLFTLGLKNIVTVHHTIEIEEGRILNGIQGKIQLCIENYFGSKVINKAKGIVCVTPEIAEHEISRTKNKIPYYCYPNAIDDSYGKFRKDCRSGIPKIIFTAAYFAEWHGLDLLLESVIQSSNSFELHIVGTCSREQLTQITTDNRVKYHGELINEDVTRLANKMDIGIASLALDRKGMKSACTLKVREYLALGIPVYSGHTDSGLPTDFAYYKNGEVDIENIISFAMKMREITPEIVRSASLPYISKKEKLRELYKWLSEIT